MSDADMAQVVRNALASMGKGSAPGPMVLEETLRFMGSRSGLDRQQVEAISDRLLSDDPTDPIRCLFNDYLLHWDNTRCLGWAAETEPNTEQRRQAIYSALAVGSAFGGRCDKVMPPRTDVERQVIIAEVHEPWYEEHKTRFGSFYWDAYERYLREVNNWPAESIVDLDEASDLIIERLSDPCRGELHQVKGLVVGYVQSGKTANFTAVIAKAADAGYRLIIVLAGMLNLLRKQTQRRIDKELIGKEIIARSSGGDSHDYSTDAEWDSFVEHGELPSRLGAHDWQRLTGPDEDYQALRRGIDALEFEKADPARAFNTPINLRGARARLIVLKKKPSVITKLVRDLNQIGERCGLEDIPTLIIDDESDQASVDTSKPRAKTKELEDRKATNREIVRLLQVLPRSQYIGYTATPFANVFINPDDAADLFPKDFLIPLKRPQHYMGVRDFFDLDVVNAQGWDSNETAYVRPVIGEDEEEGNLLRAIDSFVLGGAIKLFREAHCDGLRFRHHTMLVHRSHRVSDHDQDAARVSDVYSMAGYRSGEGLERLDLLLREDFVPVHGAKGDARLPLPEDFELLEEHIGEVLVRLESAGGPVSIVNGDRARKDEAPDFDKEPVWRILVGGTKLSRGYTVEGLTVSYYRRRAKQADTLMQMGRWFGFRRGYRDLVRLFIGTAEPDGKSELNLYQAFHAICLDEEEFRQQLDRYGRDRTPPLTPKQIPPLVPMHLLQPTARNKMFNARVVAQNLGGRLSEPTLLPEKRAGADANLKHTSGFLDGCNLTTQQIAARIDGQVLEMSAVAGDARNDRLIAFLEGLTWSTPGPLTTATEFLRGKIGDPGIVGWSVLLPQVTSRLRDEPKRWSTGGASLVVVERARIEGRFGVVSDPKHVSLARALAGLVESEDQSDDFVVMSDRHKGVLLVYPCRPPDEKFISIGIAIVYPANNLTDKVLFSVHDPSQENEVVVDQGS